jgi:hypothetical protein
VKRREAAKIVVGFWACKEAIEKEGSQVASMTVFRDVPFLLGLGSAFVLCLADYLGATLARRSGRASGVPRHDLDLVTTASLTLLGLIIGFSFSMSLDRYNQRKESEAKEASAISTEYMRVALLPQADAARMRELLKEYLGQRLLFYDRLNQFRLAEPRKSEEREPKELDDEMWSIVLSAASATPNPPTTLVVSGLDHVLSTADETQAAWTNRIPSGAWTLLEIIAICSCVLMGYGAQHRRGFLIVVFPLLVSVAFFLIAEIDSPGGIIRVTPDNLTRISRVLNE